MAVEGFFHLHLVSDATGETLINVARAATSQYQNVTALEHLYPLIRTRKQLDNLLSEIEASPGIVLYTLLDDDLVKRLEQKCRDLGVPSLSVMNPIMNLFQSYLGTESISKAGAQHSLNADYFRRIDALNFTMMHDDGHLPDDFNDADIILLGVSRTSKTPTAIYLANRGIKTANIPLVPHVPLPNRIYEPHSALVVGLVASAERIVQIRENRILGLNAEPDNNTYIDMESVKKELRAAKSIFASNRWPCIDVTKRSIEETSAEILKHLSRHREKLSQQKTSYSAQ